MLVEALDTRFGNAWLSHGGAQINISCPFCPHRGSGVDNSGHLGLNFVKNGGVYHCVKCDAGGKGLAIFLERNGIPSSLYSLRRHTAEDLRRMVKGNLLERRTAIYEPPILERKNLPHMRRLSPDDFETPSVYGESLLRKHLSWEEAESAVLCAGLSGKHLPYVFFPFFESLDDTDPCYWQGRDATGQAFLRKLNPSTEECPQGKNHWLYGFEYAERGTEVYLVEGTLDRISLQGWLQKNRGAGHLALAIQGTILSFPSEDVHPLNSQYGKLASLKPTKVWIVFDPDAWKKAQALAAVLQTCGMNAEAVRLFKGDPNEASAAGDLEKPLADRASAFKEALFSATFIGSSPTKPSTPRRTP